MTLHGGQTTLPKGSDGIEGRQDRDGNACSLRCQCCPQGEGACRSWGATRETAPPTAILRTRAPSHSRLPLQLVGPSLKNLHAEPLGHALDV